MTNKPDQFVEAVAKLLALTQEGRLIWESSPQEDPGLYANHRGQRLRLRKLPGRRQTYYNEPPSPDIRLDFLGASGETVWDFPEVEGLEDLYQAASYQASGAKDFLRDLLGDG